MTPPVEVEVEVEVERPHWYHIRDACLSIKRQLVIHPARIVGISRGGLVPAVMLSHMLGVSEFHMINCASYTSDHKRGSLRMYVPLQTEEVINRADTLIVDDILDSGTTHSVLRHHASEPWIAALFSKKVPHDPKFIMGQLVGNVWLEFPWERA